MEIFLPALLLDKATTFHTKKLCSMCVYKLSVHVVNSVKCRVGCNLVTRAVCIFRKKKTYFVIFPM